MLLSEELKETTPFSQYLNTRREEATRKNVFKFIRYIVGDPNAFLKLAKNDKRKAEECLIQFVVEKRESLASSSITVQMSAMKGYLEYFDVVLNWRRIKSVIGRARFIANDRAPTKEEVRKLLDVCDLRMKACVLVLASCGMRAGAICDLKSGDINFLKSGIARVRVYAGSLDEYQTFISSEAVNAVRAYMDARVQVGENLTPNAIFMRDKWTYSNYHSRLD
ncbi:MAG: tyrosine-type recombinase/integrase, partial [Thaumarchaeota archaeon]|nr:tyrosine-type recombinase/integrase [Nitrososphaerota archaeon]